MPKFSFHRRRFHHTSAYHGKGVSHLHIPRAVPCVCIALAAAGLILLGIALYLQRYMVYSREGGTMVLPGAETEDPSPAEDTLLAGLNVLEETAAPEPDPNQFRAVQISVETLLSGEAAGALAQAEGSALILDMKPVSGVLNWNSGQTLDGTHSPVSDQAEAIESAIAGLAAEGVCLIARLHCFQDAALAADARFSLTGGAETAEPPLFVRDWLDPSLPEVQDYIINLAKELTSLGFDEVLVSDAGYPPDWEYDALTPEARAEAVDRFGAGLKLALAGGGAEADGGAPSPRLGVETDEITVRSGKNSDSGQIFSALTAWAGRIWCSVEHWEGLDEALPEELLQNGGFVLVSSAFQTDCPSSAQAILEKQ